MPLWQSNQVEIVPLAVAGYALKGEPARTIDVFGQKRFGPRLSEPSDETQCFVRSLQRRQGRHPHACSRPCQKAQSAELDLRRGREGASPKEPMHAHMVYVMRD